MSERFLLSDLIDLCQQVLAEYGDIPVVLVPDAGEAYMPVVLVGTITLEDGSRQLVIE